MLFDVLIEFDVPEPRCISSPPAATDQRPVAARLRSASRGSAAFGAEVGRMAEKQRRWTLHRRIPIYDVVK